MVCEHRGEIEIRNNQSYKSTRWGKGSSKKKVRFTKTEPAYESNVRNTEIVGIMKTNPNHRTGRQEEWRSYEWYNSDDWTFDETLDVDRNQRTLLLSRRELDDFLDPMANLTSHDDCIGVQYNFKLEEELAYYPSKDRRQRPPSTHIRKPQGDRDPTYNTLRGNNDGKSIQELLHSHERKPSLIRIRSPCDTADRDNRSPVLDREIQAF